MRLLHTSDWHLGAMDGERSLLDDQRYFIDEICSIVKDNEINAVVIAGDVFDRSVASAEAIKLYDGAMTRLCRDLKTEVILIAGNHDGAERLANCGELLSASGLHIRGSLSADIQPVSYADTDIYLLPWITEEKVKSVFPEHKDEIKSLEDAYRVVTDRMRETFDAGKKHIIVSHAFITDAETSKSDRAAEIGFAAQVSASVFDGFDYVALGHLHKPQDVAEHIRYSGTPLPYSFGKEETQEKSVTVLDTSDMSRKIIPLTLLHPRRTFAGTYAELCAPQCSEAEKNGYVRLQVTDSYVGLEALSELRRVYPNLLEVSGKSFEGENTSVTMTMEQLQALETDPVEVFRFFCREETDIEPDERLIALFQKAVEAAEEGNA